MKKTVNFRLSPHVLETLDSYAAEKDITRTSALEELVLRGHRSIGFSSVRDIEHRLSALEGTVSAIVGTDMYSPNTVSVSTSDVHVPLSVPTSGVTSETSNSTPLATPVSAENIPPKKLPRKKSKGFQK